MPARAIKLSLALVLLALPALADEEEATLTLEAGPSFMRVEELQNGSAAATVPGGGGSLRFSYGLSDRLAVDLGFGAGMALNAEYQDQTVAAPMTTGDVVQDAYLVRATAGATVRFGARWIPFAGARLGYQRHWLTNAVLFRDQIGLARLPDRAENDLCAVAGAGLELRLDRHWIVGVAAEIAYAHGFGGNSLAAIEVPLRVSYAFYPGWFHPMRVVRFGE